MIKQHSTDEMAFLKKNLHGPILKIINPADYSIEDILKSYFREIMVMAKAYTRPNVEFEDLVVEGIMGLLDAIKRFDPVKAKDNPKNFHNLAIIRIKSLMFEYFLSNSTQYTTPTYMMRAMSLVDRIRKAIEESGYQGDTNRALLELPPNELEGTLPPNKVEHIQGLKERMANLAASAKKDYSQMVEEVLRIQENIQGYEAQMDELTGSPEEQVIQREFFDKVVRSLSPHAREVLLQRSQGKTLNEVGDDLGFTRERARQIEEETFAFLRQTRIAKEASPD